MEKTKQEQFDVWYEALPCRETGEKLHLEKTLGQVQTWALKDDSEEKQPKRINRSLAREFNQQNYGIFHTANSFLGDRKKINIARVNSWFIEIDEGTKEESLLFLARNGLPPTQIVESKRGLHVYWACLEPSFKKALETWDVIVKDSLVPFYKGDRRASDITRLLRVPDFFHLKNPAEPFLIKKLHSRRIGYTCDEMLRAYTSLKKKREPRAEKALRLSASGDGFWEDIKRMPVDNWLDVLSGTDFVGGDTFELKENSDGTRQIWVNGKNTSSWIDAHGLIGSYDRGGPTIVQWLNWYHRDYAKCAAIFKELMPLWKA